MIIYKIR